MALINYNTVWTYGTYIADLIHTLKSEENLDLSIDGTSGLTPYYDGSIAIGYGFDLLVHSNAEINTFLADIGLGPLSTQDAQLLDAGRHTSSNSTLKQIASQLSLNLGNESNATTLLIDYLNKVAEINVDNFLSSHGLSMPPSQERIALVSLAYNNPNLLGNGLAAALQLSDPYDARAEAWYQIRYVHKAGQNVDRRYAESDIFSLYDPGTVTLDEAFSVYRMYTKYRDTITKLETQYPPSGQSISDELLTAANVLVAQYHQYIEDPVRGGNNTIFTTDIQVTSTDKSTLNAQNSTDAELLIATDQQTNTIKAGSGNDILIGATGNDSLYGGDGNDVLVAGGGNDLLDGGTGTNDYYIYSGNPGAVEIKDGTGTGAILLDGTKLTAQNATFQGNNKWIDGNTTYQLDLNKNTLTITSGSDTITIDNFDIAKALDPTQGYLGIHLADQVTLGAGTTPLNGASSDQAANVPQGALQQFVVSVAAVANEVQTLRLQLASSIGVGLWELINGADTLSFAADGSVQITIPAGQSSVSLASLLRTGMQVRKTSSTCR